MSEWRLKNGWRVKPKLEGDPKYAKFVQDMAEAQRLQNPVKQKPVKPDNMTQEEWILSMQAPSTQSIMKAQKDPNYAGRDWTAPLPDNVLANPNAKTKDEMVGTRLITHEEFDTYNSFRKRSKNTLGQSIESGVTKESRERGSHHFLVSPPANPSEEEISSLIEMAEGLKGIPASIPKTEWKKLSPWKAFWHWVRGGEVKRMKE